MKRQRSAYHFFSMAVVFTVVALVGAASFDEYAKSQKQKEVERLIYSLKGPDLYKAHCAPCHGADGRGSGPVAPALKDPLPDLTTIAQRNAGVFPAERIRSLISGDEVLIAHGSREMPIWGPIFHQIENDRDYGHVRLQNVTEYLQSMQQK